MWKTAIAVAAAAIATAGALLVIAQTTTQRDARQNDINTAVCTAVVKLDGAITDTLIRSLKSIPKLAYYKAHPQEREQQLKEVKQTLKEFVPPPECNSSGIK